MQNPEQRPIEQQASAVPKAPGASPGANLLPLGAAMLAGMLIAPATLQAQEQALPTVNVRADADLPPDGYRASTTRVGKVLQDPHDIPQAVTSVTRSLMDEQQVGSLKEALRNVSGLTFNAAEGGRSGDNMNLRGFYTFGDMYLDGIRDTAQYNRETFNLEQVDVLRGAGAMLFGRGQAGGVINLVTKTPLLTDKYRATATIGSNDHKEVTLDLNKRFSPDTGLRVNLMNRDEGSWRSNPATGADPELHRQGAAISLALNQTSNNRFWLNYQHTKTRDVPDYGISFDGDTRRPSARMPGTYFWGTAQTFDDSDTKLATLVHEYAFSSDTLLRTQLRQADYKRSYWAKTPNLTTPPDANGVAGGNQTRVSHYETLTLQSDLSTKFNALGMKHEFLTGFEYLQEDSFRKGLQNFGGTTAANPPRYQPYEGAVGVAATTFTGDNYALYVQDTVEFIPQWKLTLGVRRDEMRAKYSSATSPKLNYGEWSTRGALSYHPTDESHYYLGYSDSFSPTADLYQLTSTPLPAERSQVTELGAKWLMFEGDLALRAAVYRAQKEWERNTDLESTAALLSRKRSTNGLELEVAGRVTSNWEVFGGLALMDAKINDQYDGRAQGSFAQVTANGTGTGPTGVAGTGYAAGEAADANQLVYDSRSQQVSEGRRPRNTPRYTFNLWTTYKFAPSWKAGLGFETKADRYGFSVGNCGTATQAANGRWTYNNCSNLATANIAPAYIRWDAMVAFEQPKYSVKLNVLNIFNKLYYDAIYDNGGFTVPGQKRKFLLTTEYKF